MMAGMRLQDCFPLETLFPGFIWTPAKDRAGNVLPETRYLDGKRGALEVRLHISARRASIEVFEHVLNGATVLFFTLAFYREEPALSDSDVIYALHLASASLSAASLSGLTP